MSEHPETVDHETETNEAPALVRPVTRADCRGGVRPCPWASCKFNLLVDVDRGAIALNVPNTGSRTVVPRVATDDEFNAAADKAVDAWFDSGRFVPSCTLDAIEVERGEMPLQIVGDLMCITRERVRQIEAGAFDKLKRLELIRVRAEKKADEKANAAV